MADIRYELANYLEDAGFGTVGTSIFIGQIPDNTNGYWIMGAGGQANNYLPISDVSIDLYVKNTKSETARENLESVKSFIHRMHNTTTPNAYIYSILALGDIEDLERDMEYAGVYRLTLIVKYRNLNLIS